jgi:hypothetical protein
MASRTSTSADEAVDRLLLDIKALMLLTGSGGTLPGSVKEKILSSHDEQISAFVSEIGSSGKISRGTRATVITALSEMILASILVVAGLAFLAPAIVGFSSPAQLVSYFDQIITAVSVQSLSSPAIPAIEIVLALVLLFGAFYNLRLAAQSLRTIETNPSSSTS